MIPVRCFSCGSVISSKYDKFKEKIRQGMKAEQALNELGIKRYCCRRMIVSHVEWIDELIGLRRETWKEKPQEK